MALHNDISKALAEEASKNRKHFKGIVWKSKQFKSNNKKFSIRNNKKFYGESFADQLLSETPIQTMWSKPPESEKDGEPTPDGDYEQSTEHFKVPKEVKESDALHINMDAEEKAVANLIQAEEGVQLGQPEDGDFYGGHEKNALTKTKNKKFGDKKQNKKYWRKESLSQQIYRTLDEAGPFGEDPVLRNPGDSITLQQGAPGHYPEGDHYEVVDDTGTIYDGPDGDQAQAAFDASANAGGVVEMYWNGERVNDAQPMV